MQRCWTSSTPLRRKIPDGVRFYPVLAFRFSQPGFQPIEEYTLPEDAVLWLEYMVALVREIKEFARYAFHLCSSEGFDSLIERYAEVFLVMDDQHWRIPVLNELMG